MTASGKDSSVSPSILIKQAVVWQVMCSRQCRSSGSPCVTKARCSCSKDGFQPGLVCNPPLCSSLSHSSSWRTWLTGHDLCKTLTKWLNELCISIQGRGGVRLCVFSCILCTPSVCSVCNVRCLCRKHTRFMTRLVIGSTRIGRREKRTGFTRATEPINRLGQCIVGKDHNFILLTSMFWLWLPLPQCRQ